METDYSAFDQSGWRDRKTAVTPDSLQQFAAKNNFTFTAEAPYDPKVLGPVIRAVKGPTIQNRISGTMHKLPFQLFQRWYVHASGNRYGGSTYDRTTMLAITLPYDCPEIVIRSELASYMDIYGIRQDENYPRQRVITGDPLFDQMLHIFAPQAASGAVQQFLAASGLAEALARSASFCELRFSGNLCIAYIAVEGYIMPNGPISAAPYLYGMTAAEAITQALSAGFAKASLKVTDPGNSRLRISNAPDWKVFGWGLVVVAGLVAAIDYSYFHKVSTAESLGFVGCLVAIVAVYFIVTVKRARADKNKILQQLQARYGTTVQLP